MRKKRFTAFLLSLAMAGTSLYTCSVIDVQAAAVEQEAENPNLEQLAEIQEQAAVIEQDIDQEVQAQAVEEVAAPEEQAGDIASPIGLKNVEYVNGSYEAEWGKTITVTDQNASDYDYEYAWEDETVGNELNTSGLKLQKEDYGKTLTITRKLISDPTKTESVPIRVAAKKITPAMVEFVDRTVSTDGISYNGTNQAPALSVNDRDSQDPYTFNAETEYSITKSDGIEPGPTSVTVMITKTESVDFPYTGSCQKAFKIFARPITALNAKAVVSEQSYTGGEIAPSVKVTTDDGVVELKEEDYTINYNHKNVNVGEISGNVALTATGQSRFNKGQTSGSYAVANIFKIVPSKDATFDVAFKGHPNGAYEIGPSVNAISADVTVSVNGKTVSTDDYSFSWFKDKTGITDLESKLELGAYTLKVTGKHNYDENHVSQNAAFSIGGTTVSAADISVSVDDTKLEYDGKAKLPNLVVSINGKDKAGNTISSPELKLDEGYVLENPVNNVHATSVSAAKVTVRVKGAYNGTKEISFNIHRASLSKNATAKVTGEKKLVYNGQEQCPEMTVEGKPGYTVSDGDYKIVAVVSGTDAGKARCIISANDSGNYKDSISGDDFAYEIVPKSISDSDIAKYFNVDGKTYNYTGKQVKPAVELKYDALKGNKVLSGNESVYKGVDYKIEYGENIKKGTNTGSVKLTGQNNYCGTLEAKFSIGASGFTKVTVSDNDWVSYNGKVLSENDLYVKVYSDSEVITHGNYTVSLGDAVVQDAGTYTLTIYGDGFYDKADPISHNYRVAPREFINDRGAVKGTVSVDRVVAYKYRGGIAAPKAYISDNGLSLSDNRKWLEEDRDYTLTYTQTNCTLRGKGNYKNDRITTGYKELPTPLTEEFVTVSGDSSYEYKAVSYILDPKKLKVHDKVHNVDLVYGEDFTTGPLPSVLKAGPAEIEIKGITNGNYIGTQTISINIMPKDIADEAEVKQISENGYATSVNYTGTAAAYTAPDSLLKNCLSFNGEILNGKNSDYDVKLRKDGVVSANYKDVGVYEIVAVAKEGGNYRGARVLGTLTVNAIELKPENFRLSNTRFDYKEGVTPDVRVIPNVENLLQDRDYTVEYAENPGERGTHTIKVTGKGNYAGTIELTYVVGPITLSEGNTVIYYAGTESDNALVQVTAEGKALVPDKDYEVVSVVAKAGTDPKAWDVTIKGVGAYEGTFTQEVKEGAITILETNVSVTGDFTYNGKAQAPAASDVKVTVAGRVLSENTDYTVAIPNDSVDAGSYAVTVVGTGAYTGTVQAAYEIKAIAFTEADVKVDANVEYAGSTVTPPITITVDGKELVLGTDYIVESDDDMENVGKKTVTITGIGNYANTAPIEKTFNIVAASLANAKVNVYSPEYTGAAQTAKVTSVVMNNRIILKAGVDYTVETKKATNAGTVKVTVTGKGNYKGTATGNFVIRKKDIAKASVTNIQDKTYTGKAVGQTSALKVVVNKKRLTKDKEYTVSYSKNKAIGKASFTVKGKGNYTGTTSAYSFRIFPKKATIAKLTAGSKRFTVQAKKLGGGVKYQIQYRVKGSKAGYTRIETKNPKKVIKGLRKGKTYTVKVRAYKKIKEGNTWKMYYGAFSKAKNVKVK